MKWTVLKTLFGAWLVLSSVADAVEEPLSTNNEESTTVLVIQFPSEKNSTKVALPIIRKLSCRTNACCWGWCFIYSAVIDWKGSNVTEILDGLANATKIVFKSSFIKQLSLTKMDTMAAVEHLQLEEGNISSIYVKPTLLSLWAQNNFVQEILINDKDNYQLEFLEVSFNKLKSFPANIHRLKKLVHLHLNDNEIEAISLDALVDMKKLQYLELYRNKILTVDTTVILQLPTLFEFNMRENEIVNLTVILWELPNLKKLYLGHNNLSSIEGSLSKFRNLSEISLYENKWKCEWLLPAAHKLQINNVIVHREEFCFEKKKYFGICCELPKPIITKEGNGTSSNVTESLNEQNILGNGTTTNLQVGAKNVTVNETVIQTNQTSAQLSTSNDTTSSGQRIEQHEEKIVNLNETVKQANQTSAQLSTSTQKDNT